MRHVSEYIIEKLTTMSTKELAMELNISSAMVGQYKLKRGYLPSITVACTVYKLDKVALHPFSEESLKFEIAQGR